MTDFSTIIDHPDNEEIISKIVIGTNPKVISQWLKTKYANKEQKHLCLSVNILQEFIDKHVDLDAQLNKDIISKKTGIEIPNNKISAALANNKSYQERLIEMADEKIDYKKKVNQLILICESRMEQLFDSIQQNPTQTKADYMLLKYFEVLFNAIEKGNKIVNDLPDQLIQHNVQVYVAEQHISIFQEAIRDTLAHMDTESALLFMEIFTEKLNTLRAPKEQVPNYNAEAKLLKEIELPKLE